MSKEESKLDPGLVELGSECVTAGFKLAYQELGDPPQQRPRDEVSDGTVEMQVYKEALRHRAGQWATVLFDTQVAIDIQAVAQPPVPNSPEIEMDGLFRMPPPSEELQEALKNVRIQPER